MDNNKLIDKHGRMMTRLRLSIADKCNFRCVYCMPKKPKFVSDNDLLTREEIKRLCGHLNSFGINQIRLTGGEPSLRHDLVEIASDLSLLNLEKLSLTTNGFFIEKFLTDLEKTNCKSLNFSLDSLSRTNFLKMAKVDALDRVLSAIFKSKELGFKVKINTVVMKDYNHHEICDFVEFAAKYDIEVRFLESMKIGVLKEEHSKIFYKADDILDDIQQRYGLEKCERKWSSTSLEFKVQNGAKIGLIASESYPFCSDCSRLRISATGIFRPCLMVEQGINVRHMERDDLLNVLGHRINEKPLNRIEDTSSAMYQLGG